MKQSFWRWMVGGMLCAAMTLPFAGCGAQTASEAGADEDTMQTTAAEEPETLPLAAVDALPDAGWQGQVTFPDWKGYTDDTLAMNSMYTFFGYHGQGTIYVQCADQVETFHMYVNGQPVDTSEIPAGSCAAVDISSAALDGMNTIQVSNISPADLAEAVTVSVPYPVVLEGKPEEEGISPKALELISDLIEKDVENGFPGAQLSIIRNGRLVYEKAWGKTNAYLPDGTPNEDSPAATTDTLYDLASITKMASVNYALQKLLTEGQVDLDAKITEFLDDAFADDTIMLPEEKITEGESAEEKPDLETLKKWKAELTIRDLLRHQGGLPEDPKYPAPRIYQDDLPEGETYPVNPLYAGNSADEAARQATIAMICKTPPVYEPGTKTLYSDLDYMILGLVVEKITGQDLDTYMKESFFKPMGLTHITFNPLKNGFSKDDCAATELNGNTRDGLLDYAGYRTQTIQGEVHDEKAWYSMAGVSGHAGLFSNATDLAKLGSVMLCGGYGENRFFSTNVMDIFTAPKKEDTANWGLGWWRQGDNQRVWYFGTQADSDTFGHQGWTGTLLMIDPDRHLVVSYLTNRKNSRVTDIHGNANVFDGDWYTAGTLGFVPQILSIGMDTDQDITGQLQDLTADMAAESLKLIPEGVSLESDHPAAKNARSKKQLR